MKEGYLMRDRFNRFMQGRYGVDQLGRFTITAALVFIVLSVFLGRWARLSSILNMIGFAGVIYSWFRMFSKNYAKRSEENRKYLEETAQIRRKAGKQKYMMNERKTNHIYTCPGCRQKIRIPRGKGKIEISCPKCGTKFVKNS